MHIVCEKENLLKGIRIIETAVSSKATLPILGNFLIETETKAGSRSAGKIKMVSTDLEIGLKCYIDAKIIEGGGCTIPAKRFGSLIGELSKDDKIEIKVDKESHVDIKSGKSHFVLMGTSVEDYPALPEFSEKGAFTIDMELMSEMIKKTIFAVSTEETRYSLNGVYFIIEEKQLKMVATDGRRLAYIFNNAISETKETNIISKGIVPTKTINEVIKIISLIEPVKGKTIKFSINENQIAFQLNDITIVSRLIDGTFPNYEQVIPKKNQIHIEVNRQSLLSATKQMSLFAADKSGAIKYSFGKTGLKLSAVSQGIGSGDVEIEIKSEGQNIETAFNFKYIIDILKNIDEENIIFELNGSIDAVIVRPVGRKNYICVVMPMRFLARK